MQLTDLIKIITTPVFIVSSLFLCGCLIGKIRIKGMSIGISAVLILAVLVGLSFHYIALTYNVELDIASNAFIEKMNFLSSFGSAIFVSAIGIASGYEIILHRKSYHFFIIGSVSAVANFLLMRALFLAINNCTPEMMYGAFCGAMTTTPGLAAVCNASEKSAIVAPAGYACTYILGVLFVVFFVQTLSQSSDSCTEKTIHVEVDSSDQCAYLYGFPQISFVIVAGSFIGSVTISSLKLSIGTVGTIFITGILTGYLIKKTHIVREITRETLQMIKTAGLVMFFIGTGIQTGIQLPNVFSIHIFLYGVVFTLFPIFISYFLSRIVFKESKGNALSAVCGTMTSTPAFGALSHQNRVAANASAYSASYIGSLLAIITCFSIRI